MHVHMNGLLYGILINLCNKFSVLHFLYRIFELFCFKNIYLNLLNINQGFENMNILNAE